MRRAATLAMVAMILAGCIVATRYETLRATPSTHYSGERFNQKYSEVHEQKGEHGYRYLLKIGDTQIYFATIRLSEEVVSAGVVLPVIPIPDKPADYTTNRLKLYLFAWPEEAAISFYPDQFQVMVNRSAQRLSPIAVIKEKSYGAYVKTPANEAFEVIEDTTALLTIQKERIDAIPVWPKYTLVFDVKLKDIDAFTVFPALMFHKGEAYLLPDIDYSRYSHTQYE